MVSKPVASTEAALRQRISELEVEVTRLQTPTTAEENARVLTTIVNSSPIGIGVIEDRKIVWGNAAMARIFGGSNDEYIGKSTRIIYASDEEYERVSKALYRELVDGRWPEVDFKLRRFDGSIRDATVQVAPIDPRAPLGRAVATIVDITDRKRAERDLLANEAHFRELAELLPEPVYEASADGTVTYANKATMDMFGLEAADLGRVKLIEAVVPEDRCRAQQALAELAEGRAPCQMEYIARSKDSRTFPARFTSAPIWKDAGLAGYRGVVIDLTEQKEQLLLEQRVRQAEKLEALSTLAGGIAHDFNNLLFIVAGNAELAQRSTDDATTQHFISEILVASNQARELAQRMLSFGRRQRQGTRQHSPIGVVEAALRVVETALPEGVSIEAVRETNQSLAIDPTELQQIVSNLCANAGQAMVGEKNTIHVAIKETILQQTCLGGDESLEGPFVLLEIHDQGSGIDPSIRSKIFDPYFSTKAIGKGTGLGLSVVRGLVQAAGGAITVESEVGTGSCFRVYLPVSMEVDPLEITQPTKLPRGSEKILVVDDEPTVLELLDRMLSSLGYRVAPTKSPHEALRLLGCPHDFDLLLSDVVMPGMTGHELARAVRKIHPRLPLVLCSGSALPSDPDILGLRLLSKPIGLPELAHVVREALDLA